MRVAIYSENLLANSGGAEVYALRLAEALRSQYSVTIFTNACFFKSNKRARDVYAKYGTVYLSTKKIWRLKLQNNLFDLPFRFLSWLFLFMRIHGKYELFINCSSNRMPGFFKTKSIHLIHFPVKSYSFILGMGVGNIFDGIYRSSYCQYWSNSSFTRGYVAKYWNIVSDVVYPPICMEPITEPEISLKDDMILVVGRLVPEKKVLEMLKCYLRTKSIAEMGYKLTIVGNTDDHYHEYLKAVRDLVGGNQNVRLVTDIGYDELIAIYKRSKIYWHAKGFMENDQQHPELMEHFGMTTVEAMANGCIPVVINKAGQKEIVQNGVDGFLWDDLSELALFTENIIKDPGKMQEMRYMAIVRSCKFLYPNFKQTVLDKLK